MVRSFDELVDEAAAVLGRRLGLLLARRPRHRAAPVVGLPAAPRRASSPRRRRRWTSRPAAVRCSPAPEPRTSRRRWSPPRAGRPTSRRRRRCCIRSEPSSSPITSEPPLPFADGAFDLVTSRHPATVHWSEIARVLAPGGTYFAQHVGGGTNVEISEYFLGPLEPRRRQAPRGRGRPGQGVGPGDRAVPERTPAAGVLRRRRDGLLPAQGRLDRAGLHRRPLPRPAAGTSTTRSSTTACSARRCLGRSSKRASRRPRTSPTNPRS